MFKNKKGDIATTLLVLMILVLCIAAAFIFLTKQNDYQRNMSQVKVIPSTYAEEEMFIFYLKNVAKTVLKANPGLDSAGFIDKFQEQYPKEYPIQYISEDFMSQINNDSKYEITIKDKNLSFKLKQFEFSRSFYYDPSTKIYVLEVFRLKDTFRQESTLVKHTSDIVFEIPF